MDDIVQFDIETNSPKIIKVVGVGGGGCNAVNHMYRMGIDGVSFLVCNTDKKALDDSPVPSKLSLGSDGLGAGNNPATGREAAEMSVDSIQDRLDDGTEMAFITAGMGGGTGTGAAPVVARVAREMGILTVGIVTIPYQWEGDRKIDQALDGLEAMKEVVDALIVIKNDKLSEVYGNMTFDEAYKRADDIVRVAAQSISDIITMRGHINLDFKDVKNVLENGGVAIIGTGTAQGEGRVTKAIQNALTSPLLNNNDVFSAKKVAFCISYNPDPEKTLMMSEMNEVSDFMSKFSRDIDTKHGVEYDRTLDDAVRITILASGFGMEDIHIEELNKRLAAYTDEQRRQQEEEQERKEQEAQRLHDRRVRYYGREIDNVRAVRRRHVYLFDLEDLDNEQVILAVDQSPTYSRDKKTLDAIHHTAAEAHQKATAEAEAYNLTAEGDIMMNP